MKLVIDTVKNKDKSYIARVKVEGVTSQDIAFKTKRKDSEKAAFEAALLKIRHIYL